MTTDDRIAAALRAWETYRMINPSASEKHWAALQRHIQTRGASDDPEALAVEGLKFLKQLEEQNGSPTADRVEISEPGRGRSPYADAES
jgi:hypothetical protein